MTDIELKEQSIMTEFKNFWKVKIEELGFDGFMEFWLNNLNDSIKSLEDPNADTENYLKNLDTEEYIKDPQKMIEGMKKELERQREGYTKIFKEYAANTDKWSAELLMGNKKVQKKDSDIIKLNSILPNKYIMPNTKINNLIDTIIGTGNREVDISRNKTGIITIINIDYENKNIDLPSNFTAYDRTVLNACVSLFEAGNECYTPDTIYRCMNGLTDSEMPSPQQKGAITKSIDKMRRLYCKLDYTNEAKARKKNTTECYIEDYILSSTKITLKAGGNEVQGYKFNSKPILYQYAQISKQIISVPAKLLNTKSALNSTDDVIIIREYLIRAIEDMKNRKRNNKITYDGIYEEIGLDIKNKNKSFQKKTEKLRPSIKKILDYWNAEKYIKDYKEYKEGRAFKGIEIIY